MIRALVPVALAAWALAGPAVAEFRRLRGHEISVRFTGMELTDRAHWAFVFEAGGRLRSIRRGQMSDGAWRVEGDQLCLTRTVDGQLCFEVFEDGPRVELRRASAPAEEGVLRRPPRRG